MREECDPTVFDLEADLFRVLGDPTRLKIITLLHVRDCCICELVPIFGISQPAVSKHMSRLKAVGLITERRQGQWVLFSLNRDRLQTACDVLRHLPDLSSDLPAQPPVYC